VEAFELPGLAENPSKLYFTISLMNMPIEDLALDIDSV
jgi:hypothetical protein